MTTSKRALADAAETPRPVKRASPSDTTTSSPEHTNSTMGGGVRLNSIGDYGYFDQKTPSDSGADVGDNDDYALFSGTPPPLIDGDEEMNGNEPQDSPLSAPEKQIDADRESAKQEDEAPAGSSPFGISPLQKALAENHGLPSPTRQPPPPPPAAADDDEPMDDDGLLLDPMEETRPIGLYDLFSDERKEFYATEYGDEVIDLKNIQSPSLCDKYPDLRDEIVDAYLQHATFVVKIWTNYDSWTGRFFREPSRVKDCGKVYISPKQRAHLERVLSNNQMSKVRLHIGTPFRTLAQMDLITDQDGLHTSGGMVPDYNGPHDNLGKFLGHVLGNIEEDGLAGDKSKIGLTLHDLDEIAKDMVFKLASENKAWYWCERFE